MIITHTQLKEVLEYDPDTGLLKWLVTRGRVKAGYVAGRCRPDGYVTIKVDGRDYLAHRLAWLWTTGLWPLDEIDHKDGNPNNNRWSNLRQATSRQNHYNSRRMTRNVSGVKGVLWVAAEQRWVARVRAPDGRSHTKRCLSKEDAAAFYKARAEELHGEFVRTA